MTCKISGFLGRYKEIKETQHAIEQNYVLNQAINTPVKAKPPVFANEAVGPVATAQPQENTNTNIATAAFGETLGQYLNFDS